MRTVDSSVKLELLDWGGSGSPPVLLACYLSTHVYDAFAPKLTGCLRSGAVLLPRLPGGKASKPEPQTAHWQETVRSPGAPEADR